MNPDKIKPGPIRHAQLQPSLVLRAESVRSVLAEVFPMSMDEWLDSLQRDLTPEREMTWWERVAGCYVEFTANRELSLSRKRAAFKIIFCLLSGMRTEDVSTEIAEFSQSARKELAAILRRVTGNE